MRYLKSLSILLLSMSIIFLQTLIVARVVGSPKSEDYIVAENNRDRISRISPDGVKTTIYSYTGDKTANPNGVAIDSAGNYIVTELVPRTQGSDYYTLSGDQLSKITPNGVRSVIFRFATRAVPSFLAVHAAGNYIVTEALAHVLSKIIPDGQRTIIYRFQPDIEPSKGSYFYPSGVAIDSSGNYIVTEPQGTSFANFYDVLSKITPNGDRTVLYNANDALGLSRVAVEEVTQMTKSETATTSFPDLKVSECSVTPNLKPGDSAIFYATLSMVGGPSGKVLIEVYLDGVLWESDRHGIGAALPVSTSDKLWQSQAGWHTVRWVLNSDRYVNETDYSNNECQVSFFVGYNNTLSTVFFTAEAINENPVNSAWGVMTIIALAGVAGVLTAYMSIKRKRLRRN